MSRSLRVLLGVTGGIAAYKSAVLVRLLRECGHEVRVALTRSATAFVAPLTLEVLSGHRVLQEEYLTPTGSGEEGHILQAQWAQVLCVAPATAHTLARLALGLADDFVTTTALATAAKLVVAPAMHHSMWSQETVQEHVETLRRRGARIVEPVTGRLASGEIGTGRMAEPEAILQAVEVAGGGGELQGRFVVVSAGPTHEPLDPVRYLGNRSSGRMGFALAAQAAARGAKVLLVSGPVSLPTPAGVERIDVTTAEEMREAIYSRVGGADLVIMAAAVADYRPASVARQKIRKVAGPPPIVLEENPDILAGLKTIAPHAIRVGFAAETENLEAHAAAKLESKAAHFLVANDVSRSDIGFEGQFNEVTVFSRDAEPTAVSRRTKEEVAGVLLDLLTPRVLEVEPRSVSTSD